MRRLAIVLVVVLAAAGGAWLLLGGGPGGEASATPDPSVPPVPPSTEIVADGRVVPVRCAELTADVPGEIVEVARRRGRRGDGRRAARPARRHRGRGRGRRRRGRRGRGRGRPARAEAVEAQAVAQRDAAAAAVDQARATLARARAARDGLPSGASGAQERAADADVDAARAALTGAQANLRAAHRGPRRRGGGARQRRLTSPAPAPGSTRPRPPLPRRRWSRRSAARSRRSTLASASGPRPGSRWSRVADTSGWRIETTDLDETTVARVAVGAPVTITFDGLPGVTVDGTVRSVALFGATSQGDIVYRAVVKPASIPDGLRWNMTATITVDAAE